jgi:hypothetical protein
MRRRAFGARRVYFRQADVGPQSRVGSAARIYTDCDIQSGSPWRRARQPARTGKGAIARFARMWPL